MAFLVCFTTLCNLIRQSAIPFHPLPLRFLTLQPSAYFAELAKESKTVVMLQEGATIEADPAPTTPEATAKAPAAATPIMAAVSNGKKAVAAEQAAAPCDTKDAKPEDVETQMTMAKEMLQNKESQATAYGKHVCEAAFAETKVQCESIKMATTMKSSQQVRNMIKNAGQAIVTAVDEAGANAENPASVSETDKQLFLEVSLGETNTDEPTTVEKKDMSPATDTPGQPYVVKPTTITAMANLGCEQLFAGVEKLCTR